MIVVTGGAGFIGSNLLAALEAAGARGLVIRDRLGTGEKWRDIAKRDPRLGDTHVEPFDPVAVAFVARLEAEKSGPGSSISRSFWVITYPDTTSHRHCRT